jgi:hypothetical protein
MAKKFFSTKNILPLTLIYSEFYNDKYEAYRIERFYKTAKGKRKLKKIISASRGSSNGRTADSGSAYLGSNPSPREGEIIN